MLRKIIKSFICTFFHDDATEVEFRAYQDRIEQDFVCNICGIEWTE